MTLKEIFKTVEGIILLSSLGLIIVTGAKIFAYLGLVGYTIVNIKGGLEKASKVINYVVNKVKNLFKKKGE